MDIQEIQERFEDLMLANPDFHENLLEKDEEGCYVDSDIADMYSMFEAGTEVGEAWQAAKASVAEGFVLIKNDSKTVVAIERMVEQQVEASGMDSRRLERLDGWRIIEAAIEAQEPSND